MYQSKTWLQYPGSTQTPMTAAAMIAQETRAANYVGGLGTIGPGVAGYNDFLITPAGGMLVNAGATNRLSSAFIALDTVGGVERYELSGLAAVKIADADPTNPRIDQIVAIAPPLVNGGASDSQIPSVSVVTGTPTSGATLSNRTGAAVLPARSILLADIVVGAAVVTITTANIRDRRSIQSSGAPSTSPSAPVDGVSFQSFPQMVVSVGQASTTFTGAQYFTLVWLPRRVASATFLRWAYLHSAVACVGSYNIGIYDCSGRLIVSTGAINFTGAANSLQHRQDTIAATTLEAGPYLIGFGQIVSAGAATFVGPQMGGGSTIGVPGIAYVTASGGVTLPTYLLDAAGLTDEGVSTTSFAINGGPIVIPSTN